MGAVNWIPKWFDPEGAATSEEIGRTFAEYLLAGLRTSVPVERDRARASLHTNWRPAPDTA
jgi:hypothetical protein